MPLERFNRRLSYVFLCATPFLVIIAAAVRALRIPGVYHVIGGVLFAAISIAAWTLGARAIRADVQGLRQLGLSGALLVAPFTIVALLWVGIGPPWVATAAENQMRYLVLIVMAITVAIGFVALREALSEAGERFYSTLGFAAIILAGPLISPGIPLCSERISPRDTLGKYLRHSSRCKSVWISFYFLDAL